MTSASSCCCSRPWPNKSAPWCGHPILMNMKLFISKTNKEQMAQREKKDFHLYELIAAEKLDMCVCAMGITRATCAVRKIIGCKWRVAWFGDTKQKRSRAKHKGRSGRGEHRSNSSITAVIAILYFSFSCQCYHLTLSFFLGSNLLLRRHLFFSAFWEKVLYSEPVTRYDMYNSYSPFNHDPEFVVPYRMLIASMPSCSNRSDIVKGIPGLPLSHTQL